jgi:hypothetical protein
MDDAGGHRLSEISQSEKDKYFMICYTSNLKKSHSQKQRLVWQLLRVGQKGWGIRRRVAKLQLAGINSGDGLYNMVTAVNNECILENC